VFIGEKASNDSWVIEIDKIWLSTTITLCISAGSIVVTFTILVSSGKYWRKVSRY